ncbi:C-type Lectin CRL-like [Phlebotomus argentipes]|uniref:C-type Lectin CRL-like n=1 Tax=Phlebotomus argentipes TaxID=94469 RepID=UPI0028930193|nr:C-type Lectin CRL-like [Phlebotomus argentipes]
MVLRDGKLLYLSTKKLNWPSAVDACASLGMELVSIASFAEQRVVAKLSDQVGGNVWIGGYNYQKDRQWRWVGNGEVLKYKFWLDKQPDNYKNKQNCIRISPIRGRMWDDLECTAALPYICEYKERK